MSNPRRKKIAVFASILLSSSTGAALAQQSGGVQHSAEEYAQSTEVLLRAAGALSRFMPKEGEALSFSADRLEELNQARAEAERVMNDPARAFLPLPGGDVVAQPALCNDRPITCNPVGTRFDDVLTMPHRAFRNECTTAPSQTGVTYLLVDCAAGWTSVPRLLRQVDDWDGRGSHVPARILSSRGKDSIVYNGYSFADACRPCRKRPDVSAK